MIITIKGYKVSRLNKPLRNTSKLTKIQKAKLEK